MSIYSFYFLAVAPTQDGYAEKALFFGRTDTEAVVGSFAGSDQYEDVLTDNTGA